MSLKSVRTVERLIVEKLIDLLLDSKYSIGVYDGEEDVLWNCSNREEVLDAGAQASQAWLGQLLRRRTTHAGEQVVSQPIFFRLEPFFHGGYAGTRHRGE